MVEPGSDLDERRAIVDKYLAGRQKALERNQIDEWDDPQLEIIHVTDRYGFIHTESLPFKLSAHEERIRTIETSRRAKWAKMIKNWSQYASKNPEKLHNRIYKGIPDACRGEAWKNLLEVPEVIKCQPGVYRKMLYNGLHHCSEIRQIDLDINRTFRDHIMFRERYCTKQIQLFNVLVAYATYDTEVRYCQGMSQIAGLFLMYMDEEDAFWSLSQLMIGDKHLMHGFFKQGFPKLERFNRHHDLIVKKFLPKVFKHLQKFNINSTMFTLKWFFQCFLDRVPFSLVLRLWDCFIYEGEMILLAMSYTLLKLHKKTILRKTDETLITFLQRDLEQDFGYHDDETIKELQKSIQELKRAHKALPAEGPLPDELPQKPFGLLTDIPADHLQGHLSGVMMTPWQEGSDTVTGGSGSYDDRSIVGSIHLRAADASRSIAATSRTSMESTSQPDDLDNDGDGDENDLKQDRNDAANGTGSRDNTRDTLKNGDLSTAEVNEETREEEEEGEAKLERSLSLYDNVDYNESLEAMKRNAQNKDVGQIKDKSTTTTSTTDSPTTTTTTAIKATNSITIQHHNKPAHHRMVLIDRSGSTESQHHHHPHYSHHVTSIGSSAGTGSQFVQRVRVTCGDLPRSQTAPIQVTSTQIADGHHPESGTRKIVVVSESSVTEPSRIVNNNLTNGLKEEEEEEKMDQGVEQKMTAGNNAKSTSATATTISLPIMSLCTGSSCTGQDGDDDQDRNGVDQTAGNRNRSISASAAIITSTNHSTPPSAGVVGSHSNSKNGIRSFKVHPE